MGKHLLRIIKIVAKLSFLLLLGGLFIIDYIDTSEINKLTHYAYGCVMLICWIGFFGTFFSKIRTYSYIAFLVAALFYFLADMIPEIKIAHESMACLEAYHGVWDYEQNICRHDCYKWDREHGCYK